LLHRDRSPAAATGAFTDVDLNYRTEAAMRGEITDYKDMRPTVWHRC
jgi:hypothetical protein